MAHGDWPAAPGSVSGRRRLPRLSRLANGSPPTPARVRARPLLPPFSLRSPGPAKLVSPLRGGARRHPPAAAAAARGWGWGWGWGRVRPSALPRSLPGVESGGAAQHQPRVRRGPRQQAGTAPCPERSPPRPTGDPAAADPLGAPGACSPRRTPKRASLSRRTRLAWPLPGVGDRDGLESWRGTAGLGPELPR